MEIQSLLNPIEKPIDSAAKEYESKELSRLLQGESFKKKLNCAMGHAIQPKATGSIAVLIKEGTTINRQASAEKKTLLIKAVETGCLKIVQLLVEAGEEINALVSKSKKKRETALHVAARSESLEIAQYLIEKGADVDKQDTQGQTPLELAVARNKLKSVQFFIENREKKVPIYSTTLIIGGWRAVFLRLYCGHKKIDCPFDKHGTFFSQETSYASDIADIENIFTQNARHLFSSKRLCSTLGLEGKLSTIPRLSSVPCILAVLLAFKPEITACLRSLSSMGSTKMQEDAPYIKTEDYSNTC